jgi:hypothetical protein
MAWPAIALASVMLLSVTMQDQEFHIRFSSEQLLVCQLVVVGTAFWYLLWAGIAMLHDIFYE